MGELGGGGKGWTEGDTETHINTMTQPGLGGEWKYCCCMGIKCLESYNLIGLVAFVKYVKLNTIAIMAKPKKVIYLVCFLADLGEARGCSTNTFVIDSFIDWLTDPLVSHIFTTPPRPSVRDRSSSYKIDIVIKNFLNPGGHLNPISGSKVTAILPKGWISSIGEASVGEGLRLQSAQ